MKKLLFLLLLPSFVTAQTILDTSSLRSRINSQIVPNGTQAITGAKLNAILNGYLNTWPDNRITALYPLTWNPTTRTLGYIGTLTGVPSTRKIQINGTQYDLSTDRTFSVGTVTSITLGTGFVAGSITTTGAINIDTFTVALRSWVLTIMYTDARARAAMNATSPIVYNSSTGNFSLSTIPVSKGGTGLASVGSNGQMMKSNGTSIVWFTPTFLSPADTVGMSANNLVFGAGLIKTGNLISALYGTAMWNASKIMNVNVYAIHPNVDGMVMTYNGTYDRWEPRVFETGITLAEASALFFSISNNLSEGDKPTMRTNLGGTTLGQSLFTISNVAATSFMRINADNSVSTLTASAFRAAIGSTTVGDNLFTLSNPGAITFVRINADNTVSALSASAFKTALGATTIGDAVFTSTNPSAVSFLRANADNSATWRSATNYLTDLGGTTVGKNLFTAANPSAITFLQVNADNTVTFNSGAQQLIAMGLTGGPGFVKLNGSNAVTIDNSSYQPLNANLTTIAGLTATTNNFIVGQSSAWASVSPATARTAMGATTVGGNLFTATNPSAITFIKVNADNTITFESAATHLTSLGAQAQLNGTGFIKASGTSISYDNSTYLTANQTITLSGDVSGSGSTAITTTIGANKVVASMLATTLDLSANTITFQDNHFTLQNATTTSKKAVFDVSSISASTTRTFTYPDANGTIALTSSNITGSAGSVANALTFNSTNFTGGSFNGSSAVTLNTIQDIATTSTPQFARLGLGIAADASLPLKVQGDVTNGIVTFIRSNATTSAIQGVFTVQSTTSGQMTDGWGPFMRFVVRDADAVDNPIAVVSAVRDGADNSGKLIFSTYNAGTKADPLTIDHTGAIGLLGSMTMTDGTNLIFGTSTGNKIGTSTSQKIGFFNSTPVVQQSGNLVTALANLGLIVSGSLTTSNVTDFGSSTVTFTNKRWTQRVGTTTSSGTPTINTDSYDLYKLTAQAANITSMTTNLSGTPNDGDRIEIQITGTGSFTLAWGTSFASGAATLPTTITTTTQTILFEYYVNSSYGNNKWICVSTY